MRKSVLKGLVAVGLLVTAVSVVSCGNPAFGGSDPKPVAPGNPDPGTPVTPPAVTPSAISTVVGNGTRGVGGWNVPATGSSTLSGPLAIVVDAGGNLFVGDNGGAHFLQQIDASTSNLHNIVGNGGWGPCGPTSASQDAHSTAVGYIQGMAISGGALFWADSAKSCVWKYDPATAAVTLVAGTPTVGVHGTVPDGDGNPYGYSGDSGLATNAAFSAVMAVALDGSSNLYIADSGNNRIRRVLASTGIVTTIAGTGVAGTSVDGTVATSAQIQGLTTSGLAVDAAGNVYFSDSTNNLVRRIKASDGTVSTIAGGGSNGYAVAGPALEAKFSGVTGLALDPTGANLFVGDNVDHVVRKLNLSTLMIKTIAGTGEPGYGGDGGDVTLAKLNKPSGLFVDAAGSLYITEYANGTVRKVTNP